MTEAWWWVLVAIWTFGFFVGLLCGWVLRADLED